MQATLVEIIDVSSKFEDSFDTETAVAEFFFDVDSSQMTKFTVAFDGDLRIIGSETLTLYHTGGNIDIEDLVLTGALLSHLIYDRHDGFFGKNSIFRTQKIGTVITVNDG